MKSYINNNTGISGFLVKFSLENNFVSLIKKINSSKKNKIPRDPVSEIISK